MEQVHYLWVGPVQVFDNNNVIVIPVTLTGYGTSPLPLGGAYKGV